MPIGVADLGRQTDLVPRPERCEHERHVDVEQVTKFGAQHAHPSPLHLLHYSPRPPEVPLAGAHPPRPPGKTPSRTVPERRCSTPVAETRKTRSRKTLVAPTAPRSSMRCARTRTVAGPWRVSTLVGRTVRDRSRGRRVSAGESMVTAAARPRMSTKLSFPVRNGSPSSVGQQSLTGAPGCDGTRRRTGRDHRERPAEDHQTEPYPESPTRW